MASNLLADALRRLGQLKEATATGGSTTTAIVAKFTDTAKFPYEDDAFKEGVLFVIRDAAGAAPEGQYQRISAYASDTGTFTVDTAFTAVIAALDTIGWSDTVYPVETMLSLASRALASLNEIALVDTSITTASGQTEYTLPVALKNQTPTRIEIRSDDTAGDYLWYDLHGWYIVPAAAGSTGLLVFQVEPDYSKALKVWYQAVHPVLTAYNSLVHETVHPELAVAMLVERALEWRNSALNGTDTFLLQRWNDAKNETRLMKAEHPIWQPPVAGKPLIFSQDGMIDNIR